MIGTCETLFHDDNISVFSVCLLQFPLNCVTYLFNKKLVFNLSIEKGLEYAKIKTNISNYWYCYPCWLICSLSNISYLRYRGICNIIQS